MARLSIEPWDRSEPDDSPDPTGPVCVPTPPPGPIAAAVDPVVWEGPESPHGRRDDGSVIRRGPARRRHAAPKPGDRRVKLGPEARAEIRRRARCGEKILHLAHEFHVDPTTIRNMLRGRNHADDNAAPIAPPALEMTIGERGPDPWIPPSAQGTPAPNPRSRAGSRSAKLGPAERAEARELARQGWGARRLAKRFGTHHETMRRMLLGRHYSDQPDAPPRAPKPLRWDREPGSPLHRDPEPIAGDVAELVPAEALGDDLVKPDVPDPSPAITAAELVNGQAVAGDVAEHRWDEGPTQPYTRSGPSGHHKLDDRLDEIRRYAAAGVSVREMSRRMGVCRETIDNAIERAGIELRPFPSSR